MITKNKIIILLLLFIVILLIPPLIFIINFKSQSLSKDISEWALFGDYIGGTMNTTISFLSLIILSYLTYIVSEQSNSENKKTNLLLRKLDSYEKLTSYFPELNQFFPDVLRKLELLNKKFAEKASPTDIEDLKRDLYRNIQQFSNFYYFLFTFNLRFGHLFKYNFQSEEYKQMVKNAEILKSHYISTRDSFEFGEDRLLEYNHEITIKLFDDLTTFINELRKELK